MRCETEDRKKKSQPNIDLYSMKNALDKNLNDVQPIYHNT